MPLPRSSFSENPLLRVSRPVSACSRCRAAKVKCDGKLPACTACEKAGRENECSAANDQFARGKERSYVAALELRIEKLDRRLSYARLRKASVAQHDNEAPPTIEVDRKDSLATIRAAIYRKAARRRENSDVNSLVSDFGFLSVNATTRDFEPSVSNMTFARLALAAAANDPLPEPRSEDLPPRQEAQATVQFYLANILSIFPAVSDTAIFSVLDDLYHEDSRPIKSSDYWLIFMVLAIGSMAQSRSTQDEFYARGVDFVARAMPYADRALMPGYVPQIQSLLLLTQYSMLDPAHFDSWHLIGFTCRAAVDLGFHQDPPQGPHPDKAVLDARRRLFYCVYALDRAISMVHARAFSFNDDSINVAFPSPTRAGPGPSLSGGSLAQFSGEPALLLFRLRQAQSRWYQVLFQSDPEDALPDATSFIWQMCHEMRRWAESLPDGLPTGIREMFELELRYSFVYCIAPSARAPHMTAYGRMLIFEHTIAYLGRIHQVVTADKSPAFYTYHDALRVYFMGSQFVAVLRDAGESLLAGASVPMPLSLPGKAPPPPLPEPQDRATAGDNLERSLRSLERVSLTLERFGERWEDAVALKQSFESMSGDVMEGLKARRELGGSLGNQMDETPHDQLVPSPPAPSMPYGQGLPTQPPAGSALMGQQQISSQAPQVPHNVAWADVDVDQIIRRGGMM